MYIQIDTKALFNNKTFLILRVFMNASARHQIKNTFASAKLGRVSMIDSPEIVYASASSSGMYLDSSSNAWLALVTIAGIIILCSIAGMIIICFTYARLEIHSTITSEMIMNCS